MKTNWIENTVGKVVAHLPQAAELFQAHKIDFCCGGHRRLGDVLREQNIDAGEVEAALERLSAQQEQLIASTDFLHMEAHDLTNYIEERHHSYLRDALPHISEVFAKVLKAHGAHHPVLFELHGLFGKLRTDLEQHLVKEEVLLFPRLDQGDQGAEAAELAAVIVAEHEAAGTVLKRMRALADDYRAPQDVCGTYRYLYEKLVELEGDLFQHIHLENNILLKDVRKGADQVA